MTNSADSLNTLQSRYFVVEKMTLFNFTLLVLRQPLSFTKPLNLESTATACPCAPPSAAALWCRWIRYLYYKIENIYFSEVVFLLCHAYDK